MNMDNEQRPAERNRNRRADLNQEVYVHKTVGEEFEFEVKRQEEYLNISGRDADIEIVEDLDNGVLNAQLVQNFRNKIMSRGLLPLQKRSIPILLTGRNLVVKAPTGTGKTAAFLLPAIQYVINYHQTVEMRNNMPLVLILSPTSDLALQTYIFASNLSGYSVNRGSASAPSWSPLGVSIFCMAKGGSSRSSNVHEDIISGTTGSVLYYLKSNRLNLSKLRLLILDEADKMVDKDRAEDVADIFNSIPDEQRKKIGVSMFSATYKMSEDNDNAIELTPLQESLLRDENSENTTLITISGTVSRVVQRVVKFDESHKNVFQSKLNHLMGLLDADKAEHEHNGLYNKTTVIFVETKVSCIYVSAYLTQKGYNVRPFSSDIVQADLQETTRLLSEGKIQAIVATNKFARGRDIPDVYHIIMFEMSRDFAEYEHRAGRTGRIGHSGKTTVLFTSIINHPRCDLCHTVKLYKFLVERRQKIPRWLYLLNQEMLR